MKWGRNTSTDYSLPSPENVHEEGFRYGKEFVHGFENVLQNHYISDATYDAGSYEQLLETYSDVLAMDADARQGLLNCLSEMINNKFGGKIIKTYLWQLIVLEKK